MACSIIRNKDTQEIERVLAPNGQDSVLFNSINDSIKDKEQALKTWAQVYTPQFKQWFGDWENESDTSSKAIDKNGEPLLENGVYKNTIDNTEKSIYNRGSYLTGNNNISLREIINIPGSNENSEEAYVYDIKDKDKSIGDMSVTNDGTYLTIFNSNIKGEKNSGTYAYLKLAEFANNNGLQLRSDRISDRMSDAAKALWNRFVDAGQAVVYGDHYIFNGKSSNITNSIYHQVESLNDDTITKPKLDLNFLDQVNIPEGVKRDILYNGKKISEENVSKGKLAEMQDKIKEKFDQLKELIECL